MAKKENKLSCRLTSGELRERKATIISALKQRVREKQELSDGFRYRFDGSDQTLDLLNDFVKSERHCCDFFLFTLTTSGPESPVWLELSGPEGAKTFIAGEMEF